MKRLFGTLLIGISLMIIEYTILLVLNQIYRIIAFNINYLSFNGAFKKTNEVMLVRLWFYFVVWLILIIVIESKTNLNGSKFKFPLINCGLYVLISLIMSIFFNSIHFFGYSFFYFLVIATFLSPLILNSSAYFKEKINSL